VPPFVEGGGKGDAETGDEFDVCSAGWLCWNANVPSLSVLPLVKLAPLSRLSAGVGDYPSVDHPRCWFVTADRSETYSG
jgi:hypothetical protein